MAEIGPLIFKAVDNNLLWQENKESSSVYCHHCAVVVSQFQPDSGHLQQLVCKLRPPGPCQLACAAASNFCKRRSQTDNQAILHVPKRFMLIATTPVPAYLTLTSLQQINRPVFSFWFRSRLRNISDRVRLHSSPLGGRLAYQFRSLFLVLLLHPNANVQCRLHEPPINYGLYKRPSDP